MPVFIVVAVVAFSILHLIPGNPAAIMLGMEAIAPNYIRASRLGSS